MWKRVEVDRVKVQDRGITADIVLVHCLIGTGLYNEYSLIPQTATSVLKHYPKVVKEVLIVKIYFKNLSSYSSSEEEAK